MNPITRRALLAASAAALGCWRAPEAGEYDPQAARQTLIAALEAWKKGQAASLARGKPPIRFADEDWAAGWQLLAYELQQPEALIRPFETVLVDLKLRDRQGRVVQRTVGYQVALKPRPAVLRADS